MRSSIILTDDEISVFAYECTLLEQKLSEAVTNYYFEIFKRGFQISDGLQTLGQLVGPETVWIVVCRMNQNDCAGHLEIVYNFREKKEFIDIHGICNVILVKDGIIQEGHYAGYKILLALKEKLISYLFYEKDNFSKERLDAYEKYKKFTSNVH
jgi:hypothetical protein